MLLQNGQVMSYMAGEDESERTNSEVVAARLSATAPGLGRQMLEQGDGGAPELAELFEKIAPRDEIGAHLVRRDVLIEAG